MNVKEHLEEEVQRLRKVAKQLAEARDYAIGVINGVETSDRIRQEIRTTSSRVALVQ